jgi:hypothetical protein
MKNISLKESPYQVKENIFYVIFVHTHVQNSDLKGNLNLDEK